MTTIVVFDTETTGLSKTNDHIVQLASVIFPVSSPESAETFESLANPGFPIPAQASALHGKTDAMVASKPPSVEVAAEWWRAVQSFGSDVLLVAHNATFDLNMLTKYFGADWKPTTVCTLRAARALDPTAPKHKLEGLAERYGLRQHVDGGAHDALADCWMCALLFLKYLDDCGGDLRKLSDIAGMHQPLKTVQFGFNKGKPFTALSDHNLRWFLDKDDAHAAAATAVLRARGTL